MDVGIPPLDLAIWVGVGVAVLLIAVGSITVLQSVMYRTIDRRRDAVRSEVRARILEGMTDDQPGWNAWVDSLSSVERQVARTELDRFLRSTKGIENQRLRGLGEALDIPSEARTLLGDGKRHEKLQALTWLALLGEPVDPDRLRTHCDGDPDLQAGGARVLFEAGHPAAKPVGTQLLLGDGEDTLPVYGLDTLYQLHRRDPAPLYERAAANHPGWRPSLIIQVLTVLSHCGIAGAEAPREWIVELTDHDLPAVRAAAVTALESVGWNEAVRETVDVDRLLADTDPATRRATYDMLAEWGDQSALETIARAALSEPDQRARVHALEAIRDRSDLASSAAIGSDDHGYVRAWNWARATANGAADP